jgi:hypothetical protein
MKNTTGKIWFLEIVIFIFCFLAISYFIGIIIDAYFSLVRDSTALHQFPIEGK